MGSVRGNETNLSLRKKERCSRDLSTRHNLYLTLSKPIWEIQLELYCDNQLWMDHYMIQSNCSIQSDLSYQCSIPQIIDWRYAHSGIHSCYMQMQDEYGQTSRADFQINYH